MEQKVEVTFTQVADNKERLQKITDILADGVYAYLKANGKLSLDPIKPSVVGLEKTQSDDYIG